MPLGQARCEPHRVARVAGGHDDAELLAAQPADDVGAAHGLAEDVRERDEHLVARAVAVDVVDALEVVDVEHEHGDRVVRAADAVQLGAQAVVEVAVVVEARQGVGLRLELEAGANLRVVERERGRVAEALGQLELLFGEDRVVAEAVDVERPLDRAARDERDGDERLGLVRRSAGNDLHARVEMRVVDELGLAVLDDPPRDAFAVDGLVAHDLVRPLVSGHEGDEDAPGLVGLVDRERVEGDEIAQRVCDPLEDCVQLLLGENVVEDLRQTAVGIDERVDPGQRRAGWRRHGRVVSSDVLSQYSHWPRHPSRKAA